MWQSCTHILPVRIRLVQLTEGLDWVITHSVLFAFFIGSNVHIWCGSYFHSWGEGQDESQRRHMPSIMKYKQSLSQAMRLSNDCGQDKKKNQKKNMHPHRWCNILISLSQLLTMYRHWADQGCYSSNKHELIRLWRHHKSHSGHSWGLPVHLLRTSEYSYYWGRLQPKPQTANSARKSFSVVVTMW